VYAQYYHYKGDTINLQVDYSRISIISNGEFIATTTANMPMFTVENANVSHTSQNIMSVPLSIVQTNTEVFITEILFSDTLSENIYNLVMQNIQSYNNIVKVSKTFTISGQPVGITNNFYVKLFGLDDLENLQNMAELYGIQVLGYNRFMPLWFTLSCTKDTPFDALTAANLFHSTNMYAHSEPEFLYHNLQSSNDTYFDNQWGLKNTGQYGGGAGVDINAEAAWTITTGSPDIKVAVFDHGFEMNHPDLESNVYGTGYDATTSTSPSVVRGSHGTACAGIVGAMQNNQLGISGIAPNSKLMSISVNLEFSDTPQQLANGFNWAWQNGADIISNSWGGYAQSSIIDDAITNTLINGRMGKGTIIIFASGNENNTAIRYPGNSNPEILVVGATSPCGERKNPYSCDRESWGGCYGETLDICAPGVLIPTTDRQGTAGYSYTEDYTMNFNGTSSACPHVAGVAALILSVNPYLTGCQVRNIIESTAQKVGGYSYQNTAGRDNGTWNNEMGYGLVDAYAAVMKALDGLIQNRTYNDTIVESFEQIHAGDSVTAAIPNGDVVISTGANVSFQASNEIVLSPGFHAQSGSTFTAQIVSCETCECTNEYSVGSSGLRSASSENNAFFDDLAKDKKENIVHKSEDIYHISLTPNPATTSVTITMSGYDGQKTIFIMDIAGREVKTVRTSSSQEEINISSLTAGVYIVKIQNSKGEQIFADKLIKN
jgi:subtilisin family serine protease